MSFLAGAFLLGLLSLAVPWWLHRRESADGRRRPIGSLLLMRPGDAPRQTRRVLRHRILLGLRLLLLTALVLAFAQPVLRAELGGRAAAGTAPTRLIVVDTSASMAAAFPQARRIARGLVDQLPPGAHAAVIGADRRLTVAAPVGNDRGMLHHAVRELRPGHQRLDFDGLLGRVTVLAGTLTERPVEIHLVSDFQRSALPDQFNGLLAGAEAPVRLHPVRADPANWAVESVAVGDQLRVVVRGWSTPARRLEVVVAGAAGEVARRPVTVDGGARAAVTMPLPAATREDAWLRVSIETGDALASDDAAFQVLRTAAPVELPLFTGATASRQADYLRAALAAAAPRFVPAAPGATGPVAVLLDPGELSGAQRRLLERHLDQGGGLLLTLGQATRQAGLVPLVERTLADATERNEPRGVVVVDRTHPALAGVGGWDGVSVSRHLTEAGGGSGSVLLALDDGAPLLVEHRLRAGRMLVLTTALDPAWSTLVTHPAFVTLVADALAYLAEDTLPSTAVAGQPLAVPAWNFQLFDAAGNRQLDLSETVRRRAVHLERPGIYTLRTPSRERLLAVNVDARESDLIPANDDLLARWESASRVLAVPPAPDAGEAAGQARALAPWLLGLLALLAVLEPIAANASVRRGAPV